MKVKALKSFEGIRDNERSEKEGRDIYPKEGDIWEVSEERADLLLRYGVVELVEDKKEKVVEEKVESILEEDMTDEQKESYEELKKEKLTEKALEKRIVEEEKPKKKKRK